MAKTAFAHRGVMLDMARVTERHEYYRELLPQLRAWGYNLLHLHFTDDQGCALRFPSHPELATPHAYSVEEMRDFCAEARRNGLEVVPEIECFGHTGYITRLKKYRHLCEIRQEKDQFSGLCVFAPEAQRILRDLLRDTVAIFEPRLVHAGLDEVNFGYHPLSKRLLRRTPKNVLFGRHVAWCHEQITKLGARMGIWGDHLLRDREEGVLADATPRDTVIFDWHYEAGFSPASLDFFLERGFEIYGCPSIQRSNNRVISSRENFANLREFSGHALARRKARSGKGSVTGMVVTIWCPYRYVAGTIEYPLAYAGTLFSSEEMESPAFPAEFAARFWGLRGRSASELGAAVHSLYHAAPTRPEYDRILFGRDLHKPVMAFCRADRQMCRERLSVVEEAGRVLQAAGRRVARNTERLADLATASEFLWRLYAFGLSNREADMDWRGLQRAMRKAWARSRYTGESHDRKPARRIPLDWGEYDGVLRHVNRLA